MSACQLHHGAPPVTAVVAFVLRIVQSGRRCGHWAVEHAVTRLFCGGTHFHHKHMQPLHDFCFMYWVCSTAWSRASISSQLHHAVQIQLFTTILHSATTTTMPSACSRITSTHHHAGSSGEGGGCATQAAADEDQACLYDGQVVRLVGRGDIGFYGERQAGSRLVVEHTLVESLLGLAENELFPLLLLNSTHR
jgi:hypothetical protein